MPDSGAARAGCVLLAEDSRASQVVTRAILRNLGFEVDLAADGMEAVDAASRHRYDAVLMDCQMPVLDGYAAASKIRRLPSASRHIPIIAVTVTPAQVGRGRAVAAGMDDYLAKPFSVKALGAILDRWITTRPPVAASVEQTGPLPSVDSAANETDTAPPVLDPEVVGRLKRLGDDAGEDLMGWLAKLFMADSAVRIDALREAIVEHNAPAVERSAHTLSGSSANVGATDLARMCGDLATAGAAGELTGARAELESIEVELERVRVALSTPAEAV